jgi:hypothetical protein
MGSYGSNDGGGSGSGNEEEEEITNFSTRINNNLLIAGAKCNGGETTTDANGNTATCKNGQWLITLDNVNRCSDGGGCTEIGVVPFVGDLKETTGPSIPEANFFEIVPVSAVPARTTNTIDDYLVVVNQNTGTTEVVPR